MNHRDQLELIDLVENQEYFEYLCDIWGMSYEDVVAEHQEQIRDARDANRYYMNER